MNSTGGVIEVRFQGNKVSLNHRTFNFQGKQTITWRPVTPNTSIGGIALRITDPPLPPFAQQPGIPGEFTARVPGAAAPNRSWQYLIEVNGRWFHEVLQTGAVQAGKPGMDEEPEEPPELVNGTPTKG